MSGLPTDRHKNSATFPAGRNHPLCLGGSTDDVTETKSLSQGGGSGGGGVDFRSRSSSPRPLQNVTFPVPDNGHAATPVPADNELLCDDVSLSSSSSPSSNLMMNLCYIPLRWLYCFLFIDSNIPEDDYFMKVRKGAIGLLLLISWQHVALVGWELSRTIASPVGLFLILSVVLPMGVTHLAGFIYCRVKKSAPDWLLASVLLTATACRCCLATTNRSMDMEPLTFAIVMIALSIRLHRGIETAVVALTVLCLVINTINMEVPPVGTVLMFPGITEAKASDSSNIFLLLIGSTLTFIMKTAVIFIVVRHVSTWLSSKDATVKLSSEVLHKLQTYDTEAARAILRGSGRVQVDQQLLAAFDGIVKKLEQYRPFLPNYLFDTSAAGETEALMTTAADGSLLTSINGTNAVGSPPTAADFVFESVTSVTGSIRKQQQRRPPGTITATGTIMLAPISIVSEQQHQQQRSATANMWAATISRDSNRMTPTVPMDRPAGHAASIGMEPTNATPLAAVSIVSVCVMAVEQSSTARADFGSALLWHAFIGIINDAAQSTGASLHSFVGDRLIATWNATKRCSKPETRACQFPLRVRAAISNSAFCSAFGIASMIATGQAECCFAGDSRLRLFACSSPDLWKRVSAGLKRIQHLHISVVDRMTKETGAFDIVFRAAGLLKIASNADRHDRSVLHRRCLYELVQERTMDAQTDQEWMYALQQHAKDPNERLIDIMERGALGAGDVKPRVQQLRVEYPEVFGSLVLEELLSELYRCDSVDSSAAATDGNNFNAAVLLSSTSSHQGQLSPKEAVTSKTLPRLHGMGTFSPPPPPVSST